MMNFTYNRGLLVIFCACTKIKNKCMYLPCNFALRDLITICYPNKHIVSSSFILFY